MTKENRIYGYEDYETLPFCFDNIIDTSFDGKRSVIINHKPFKAYRLVPITDDLLLYEAKLKRHSIDSTNIAEALGAKNYLPAPGDSLYYTKQCKLPRTKYRDIWKNVPSPAKADAVVIPQFQSWYKKYGPYMLFANDQTKQVWMSHIDVDCSMYCKQKEQGNISVGVGNTVHEFCEALAPGYEKRLHYVRDLSEISTVFDAKCIFIGTLFALDYNQIPLCDALNGKYDKVVFEDILLQNLPKSTISEFTPEIVENLYYQLMAANPDTVLMALKALACMHYNNCKTTVRLLLDMTVAKWWKYKQATTAIECMCKELHFEGALELFLRRRHLAYSVNKEEADIFIHLFKIRAEEKIKEIVKEFNHIANVHTEIDPDIKMSL